MKIFNAFQLVVLFAICPFGIDYCRHGDFFGHEVATYVLCAAYVFAFAAMTVCVSSAIGASNEN